MCRRGGEEVCGGFGWGFGVGSGWNGINNEELNPTLLVAAVILAMSSPREPLRPRNRESNVQGNGPMAIPLPYHPT